MRPLLLLLLALPGTAAAVDPVPPGVGDLLEALGFGPEAPLLRDRRREGSRDRDRRGEGKPDREDRRPDRSRENAPEQRAPPRNPFEFTPALTAELGGGLAAGIPAITTTVRGRVDLLGVGGTSTFYTDGQGWLSSTDLGPTLYLDGEEFEIGIQPSVIWRDSSGVPPGLGGGLRVWGTVQLNDRVLLFGEPKIGHARGQWAYHLRLGAAFRVSPHLYGRLSYDFRDVLGLGILDPMSAGHQGLFATVGVRF